MIWGGPVNAGNALNYGSKQLAIAGSNGYVNNTIAQVLGYGTPTPLGTAAISAPLNKYGFDSFMGKCHLCWRLQCLALRKGMHREEQLRSRSYSHRRQSCADLPIFQHVHSVNQLNKEHSRSGLCHVQRILASFLRHQSRPGLWQ